MNAVQKNIENTGKFVVIPVTDIFETADEYGLAVEMPGVKKEDLDITIQDRQLEIRGTVNEKTLDNCEYSEFNLTDYYRKFRIGTDVDTGKVNAILKDGVLNLTLYKTEEVKPKKIEIAVH